MSKQFTPCPACGAVGEVNSTCQFCGTTILLKEGAISSTERIPKVRTVTPQQYAEKISIYHNVEPANEKLLKVSIGKQYGLVNLNGDIIYPLGNLDIGSIKGNTVELGYTIEETKKIGNDSYYWDSTYEKYILDKAYTFTFEKFHCNKYLNLESGLLADDFGFVEDKENPQRLYRVDIKNNWTPVNTYTNLEGEVQTYDYAERIKTPHLWRDTMYLFYHNNETYSVWIPYNETCDKDYFGDKDNIPSKTDFKSPICVLEGIMKHEYTYNKENKELLLRLQTTKKTEVNIKIGDSEDFNKIYKRWQSETKTYNTLDSFRKKNAINQNLLAQIKSYIQEVKANPEYENILILDFDTSSFTIINNATNSFNNTLSQKPGVSLYTSFVSEEEENMFTNSKLNDLFEQISKLTEETDATYYKNFSFDAESLCTTIQYLAHYYKCPSNEIKLNEYAPCEANQSNNNNETISIKTQWIIAIIGLIIYALIKFLG